MFVRTRRIPSRSSPGKGKGAVKKTTTNKQTLRKDWFGLEPISAIPVHVFCHRLWPRLLAVQKDRSGTSHRPVVEGEGGGQNGERDVSMNHRKDII